MNQLEHNRQLAAQLWSQMRAKFAAEVSDTMRYYVAVVVSNPGEGALAVQGSQRPVVTIPCADALSDAVAGDQVLVLSFGETDESYQVAVSLADPVSFADALANILSPVTPEEVEETAQAAVADSEKTTTEKLREQYDNLFNLVMQTTTGIYAIRDSHPIAGVSLSHYFSSSRTEVMDGEWFAGLPQTPERENAFLWIRMFITYADDAPAEYTDPLCVTAPTGKHLLSVEQLFHASASRFLLSTSEEDPSDATKWGSTVPTLTEALPHLWTSTHAVYTIDGSTADGGSYTKPYCLSGALDDAEGGDIDSYVLTYTNPYTGEVTTIDLMNVALVLKTGFVAQSDYGVYLKQVINSLDYNAENWETDYTFFSQLKGYLDAARTICADYQVNAQGYVRFGIVDYETDPATGASVPVFGVATGRVLETELDLKGRTVIRQVGYRAIYADNSLSFWKDGVKIAWIDGDSENPFHISDGQGNDLIDAMNDRITLAVSTVQDLEERADSGAFKGDQGDPGESPYMLQVVSTNGGVFKNGNVSTELQAKVWHGTEEVTTHFNANDFRWTRVSADAAGDVRWNNEHYGGAKTVAITTADVQVRATFFCTLSEGAEEHEPVRITAQPADFVGELGDSASFTVEAEGYGLTYRWQVWNNGWADSGSSGNKTARLHSITITEARLGYRYRCNVTDANGNTVTSDEVRMRLPQQEE